jgi:hypothetical protein
MPQQCKPDWGWIRGSGWGRGWSWSWSWGDRNHCRPGDSDGDHCPSWGWGWWGWGNHCHSGSSGGDSHGVQCVFGNGSGDHNECHFGSSGGSFGDWSHFRLISAATSTGVRWTFVGLGALLVLMTLALQRRMRRLW